MWKRDKNEPEMKNHAGQREEKSEDEVEQDSPAYISCAHLLSD